MQDKVTALIHHPYTPQAEFKAPQPGVFKASTVFFPSVAAMRANGWEDRSAFTYGLHGTPTTYTLEQRLCTLEGGRHCLLVPSGLAAIAVVTLSLLKPGDEVLVPDNAYGNNKELVSGELKDWGVTHRYYDSQNPQDLADKLCPQTRLVWLEAAGSVTLEFPDLCELLRICREQGVTTALDNTWGAGLAFAPFDLSPATQADYGVDISMHALTKYPSGSGDVLMGSIITRDAALHRKLQATHMHLGLGVGANDAEAVLRALPSMRLRYSAHDAATRALARWAQGRAEFAQVLHPALADSPGHAHWRTLCKPEAGGAAGLFSVIFSSRYSQAQVDKFCDALCLFKLGYSWGGPVSLVVPYKLGSMRSVWPSYLQHGIVVRFAIGLEAVQDLQADLEQALATAFG